MTLSLTSAYATSNGLRLSNRAFSGLLQSLLSLLDQMF